MSYVVTTVGRGSGRTQRFMKQQGDNGCTAFDTGLKRQVEDLAKR